MLSTRQLPALLGAFALVALAAAAWPFTIDDAYIVVRYADRLAHGHGYTFSGELPTDGVTGPLWLLPLVIASFLGLDPLTAAKTCSLAAGVVAGLCVFARVRGLAHGLRAAWFAVLVLCSSLPFIVWSVAGLETGLASACATALALSVTRRPHPNGVLAGASLLALAWLRPELLAFGAWLALALALRPGARRATLWLTLLALLGLVSVLGFRYLSFGHWLPMSASAKPALIGNGLAYLGATFAQPRVWVLLPLLCVALFRGGRSARTLVLALVVHAAAVVLVGGDWMPGRRLFAPLIPVLALALALGLRPLLLARPRLVWSACGLLLLVSALELFPELRAVRAAALTQRQRAPALAALVCRAKGPVAVVDLGVLGALCPAQTFIDLGGLTEPALAYARGAHLDKHVDAAWLRARAPGLVVLHSRDAPRVDRERRLRWFAGYPVERRVLSTALMRDFRVQHVFAYAPRYFYVLLSPRESASVAPQALPRGQNAP